MLEVLCNPGRNLARFMVQQRHRWIVFVIVSPFPSPHGGPRRQKYNTSTNSACSTRTMLLIDPRQIGLLPCLSLIRDRVRLCNPSGSPKCRHYIDSLRKWLERSRRSLWSFHLHIRQASVTVIPENSTRQSQVHGRNASLTPLNTESRECAWEETMYCFARRWPGST